MNRKKGFLSQAGQVIQRVLRDHAIFIVVATLPIVLAWIMSYRLDDTFVQSSISGFIDVFTRIVVLSVALLAARYTVHMIRHERPDSPLRALARRARELMEPYRITAGTLALSLLVAFMAAFSYFKVLIPELIPFSWDRTFAELDRSIHFGADPYRLLMPLLGSPLMTTFVNIVYHAWLFVAYFVIFIACFTRHNPVARMTFLIAFVLTWFLGGNVLATLFSSAGPVYYHQLGLGDDFLPLLDSLRAFSATYPVWALDVHDILWEGYESGSPVGGISAMPSMHLASSALLALYGFTYARWAGWLLTAFTGLILLGSVHLAWHYAVDSYAGILIAVLCWKFAAWLARSQTAPDRISMEKEQ